MICFMVRYHLLPIGPLAHLVERFHGMEEATGSIPVWSISLCRFINVSSGHGVTANIHDSGSCDSGFESQCPERIDKKLKEGL